MNLNWANFVPIRTLILVLVGFSSLITAAWLFHPIAGVAALGVAALVLEFLLQQPERTP